MQSRTRVVATIASVVAVAGLVTGCAPAYQLALINPAVASVASSNVYDDGMVRFVFSPGIVPGVTSQVEFELTNRSPGTIHILWDRAAFIHTDGTAARVIHPGVRFIERDRPMPPTVVPSGTKVREAVAPVDRVVWLGSSWYQRPIAGAGDVGKQIGLLLPIQFADGAVREYRFDLQIRRP